MQTISKPMRATTHVRRFRTRLTLHGNKSVLRQGGQHSTCQWSKVERQKACPWVVQRRSVSKPKDSMTGRYARTMETGVPGLGTSSVTWPLRLPSTSYVHLIITADSMQKAISTLELQRCVQDLQRPEPPGLQAFT